MRRIAIAGVVAVVAFFIVCTWTGIDFGSHWDEYATVIKPAAGGSLLPGRYLYPSLLHDITLATATVTNAEVESKPFLLRMRRIVAVISSLTIVWVFLLVLVWRGSPLEALLAAAIAAGSWELQYHSRWLTVDPLMTQFAALTLFCAVAGHRLQSAWLLRASAVAAGLACGSKYTAGVLLVVVLIACGRRLFLQAIALFAATFLLTTPGAILEMPQLLADLRLQAQIYGSGWGVYTVSPPFEHARLLGEYVALVLLSHTPLIAAFLTGAAIFGAVVVAREDRRTALIVLTFPVAYLVYFSLQRVMIVRNVLVVVPFLAALSAIGIATLLRRALHTPSLRRVVAAAVAAMVLVNLAWLWTAARTIKRPPRVYVAQLADFLDTNPDRRFAISPRVAAELRAFDGRERPSVPPARADAVVFFALEARTTPFLPNRRNAVERWFGAHEINFNYYPTWITADRVLVMRPENVRK